VRRIERHLPQSFRKPSRDDGTDWCGDIYITPYKHKAQVVSGTLAYALSAGKAIISTPYLHAIELLNDERGSLVPFDDPEAIASKTVELLDNGTHDTPCGNVRICTRETWYGAASRRNT